MRFRASLLASAISLLWLAGPAEAGDPPIGSRLGQRVHGDPVKQERDAALGAHEMARCLANKETRAVRAYLAATDSEQSKTISKKLIGEFECLSMSEGNDLVEGRMVEFPHDVFRGMLAEWMIRGDKPSFTNLPGLPRQLTYSRPWYAVTGRDASVDEMATCVSETAPAAILALIDTTPYSDAEMSTFGSLIPSMTACLRAGIQLTGNRQSLRAALADALYQRVANPPAIAAVPSK